MEAILTLSIKWIKSSGDLNFIKGKNNMDNANYILN